MSSEMRKVRAAESVAMALDGVEAAFVPLKRQLGDVGLSRTVQKKIKGIQLAIEALRAALEAKVQPKSEFVCVETAMHHLQKRIEAEKRAPLKVDADATETDEPSAVEGDVWSMNEEEEEKKTIAKKRLSTEALDTESETEDAKVVGKKARTLIKPEPIPEYNEETSSGAEMAQWNMKTPEEKKTEQEQVAPKKNEAMADVFGGGWNDDSTEDEDESSLHKKLTPVQKPKPSSLPTLAPSPQTAVQHKEPVKAPSSDSSSVDSDSEHEEAVAAPSITIVDIENIVSALSSSSDEEEEAPTKQTSPPRVPRPVFQPIAKPTQQAAASESSSEEDEPFPKKHLVSAPKVTVDLWPCLNEMYDAIVRPTKPLLLAKNFSFPDTYSSLDEYVANMKLAILEEALTGIQDVNHQSSIVDKIRFLSLSIYTPRLNVVAFSLPDKLTLTNHDLVAIQRIKGDHKIPYRGIVYSAANTNTKEVTIILSQKHTIEPGMYSIKILSNLTTSSREYQAVSSLPTLPTVLRRLIVDAEVSNTSLGKGAGIRPLMLASLEKQYNYAQLAAIKAAVEKPLTLIQGPPGTGKTRTIVGLIGALLSGSGMQTATQTKSRVCVGASLGLKLSEKDRAAMNVRILVTAPSNAAVDVLIARLQADGVYNVKTKSYEVPKMIRIGAVPGLKDIPTSLKKNYKHTHTSIYLEHMLEQQHGTRRDHSWNPMLARQELLEKAQIVFCTLSGAGSISMCDFRQSFDAVIVDEAAQATEASSLIPLKFQSSRWILVGDHKQLPATVLSPRLMRMGYEQSMFQRLVTSNPVHFLTKQYRMHPAIAQFPSAMFYDGQLQHGGQPRDRPYHLNPEFGPYVFYDIAQGEQSKAEGSTSYRNLHEVDFIVQLVTKLVQSFPNYNFRGRIGIISPYKSQIHELSSAFTRLNYRQHVEVNTVDGFQGREKEIIIVSCVRTVRGRENTFWGDVRRMNVALTRAISSCWVVGNSALLSQNTTWYTLIEDCKARKCYRAV